MARRKRHEDHVNHEAWAIPYGDLITLLLAFFVVMYALSSVNEGKYRILSDSLIAAFRSQPKSLEPIQVGQPSRSASVPDVRQQRTLVPLEIDSYLATQMARMPEGGRHELAMMRTAGLTPDEIDAAMALIEDITTQIADELSELIDADMVRLRPERFWLEVEINTSVLFATASAELAADAEPIVRRLGDILAHTPTRVQVEGHTDSLPISTATYPSNWELSAGRAATVVRLFAGGGVNPAQLSAVGFSEFRPVDDNESAAGRARNRRVVIVIMAGRDDHAGKVWTEAEMGERGWTMGEPSASFTLDGAGYGIQYHDH